MRLLNKIQQQVGLSWHPKETDSAGEPRAALVANYSEAESFGLKLGFLLLRLVLKEEEAILSPLTGKLLDKGRNPTYKVQDRVAGEKPPLASGCNCLIFHAYLLSQHATISPSYGEENSFGEDQMSVNLDLKCALIKRFGSQVSAARELGIRESKLSYIVRRHVEPSDQERKILERALGRKLEKL